MHLGRCRREHGPQVITDGCEVRRAEVRRAEVRRVEVRPLSDSQLDGHLQLEFYLVIDFALEKHGERPAIKDFDQHGMDPFLLSGGDAADELRSHGIGTPAAVGGQALHGFFGGGVKSWVLGSWKKERGKRFATRTRRTPRDTQTSVLRFQRARTAREKRDSIRVNQDCGFRPHP